MRFDLRRMRFDLRGMRKWYGQGHTLYNMKDFVDSDSRISIIREWITSSFPNGGKVADIGCGDMTLANLCPTVIWSGFDLNDKKDERIIKQDVTDLPYSAKAESYDGVVCSEVLEHVFLPHDVISEFNRILKPGGTLIVTVPNFDSFENYLGDHRQLLFSTKEFWTVEHIRWFNSESMSKLLTDRGFEIVEVRGAAHCFSGILNYAQHALLEHLDKMYGIKLTEADAGSILGKMIPCYSPGLAYLCRKVA